MDVLKKLFAAASHHGYDNEPEDTVGDLEDLLTAAWKLMSMSQRLALLESDAVEAVIETGARNEFEAADLVETVSRRLDEMEAAVVVAGYQFQEGEDGYFWETDAERSRYFVERCDAVAAAFEDLNATE